MKHLLPKANLLYVKKGTGSTVPLGFDLKLLALN